MENAETSWVKRTGQRWKVVVGIGMMVPFLVWVLMMTCGVMKLIGLQEEIFSFATIGLSFLAVTGFFLWFIGVRCPACKGRPVIVVFGSRKSILRIYPISNWVSCPVCNDDYVTDDFGKNSTNEKGTKSQLLKLNIIERILAGIFIVVLGVYWVMSGLMTVLGIIMLISQV